MFKNTRLICLSVIFLVSFVSASVLRNNDSFQLDIVHYNDFHARFEETSVLYPICPSNDTSCLGGFARLYYEINALLKEKPNALVLNAGDTFQGTYWYALHTWNLTQHFINMLPNDAHTIGNHEFDGGVDDLAQYLAALRAPVLVANLDISQEPSLEGLMKHHIVIERRGKKIGIIGVTTQGTKTSSKAGKVEFLDPVKAVLDEAKNLTDQGIDIIVVLSHCGLDVDRKIAKEAGENIDVIVGGHSHSLLWNGDSPTKEEVSGPYPVIIESDAKPGHKILVVTAAAFTKYLGNLTVHLDNRGELVSFDGDAIFLNRSIPEDPYIKNLLQPDTEKLHKAVNEVVAYAADSLLMNSCSSGECALGDLVADALLHGTKKKKLSELPAVAFLIRDKIKASISKGDITRGAIINTLPFTNKVVTFVLQGKYLVEALEHSITNAWVEKPFSGPWMPQIAGMQATLNTTSRKVVSLKINSCDKFEPIRLDEDYQVTAPDFIAYGGNGFTMLSNNRRNQTFIGTDATILEEYIKMSTVTPKIDHRLIIVT